MIKIKKRFCLLILLLLVAGCTKTINEKQTGTIALWLFDEPTGLYPSHVMDNSSPNDYPLTLGLNGKITAGKYGNALTFTDERKLEIPEGEVRFGLEVLPIPKGRTVEPLNWKNGKFCALMTNGENHLRKEVGYTNATDTKLNLGNFDWTVEFWFVPSRDAEGESVIFEIGQGPRGENEFVTKLSIYEKHDGFVLFNQPSGTKANIKSEYLNSENKKWHHYAFVYSADKKTLTHYVDGKEVSKNKDMNFKSLPHGDEAYMTVGTDGLWKNQLSGKLDELRFSEGIIYNSDFEAPKSFAEQHKPYELVHGPKLLFDNVTKDQTPIVLGNRKHLFIDDAFIEKNTGSKFVVNPPKVTERVIDNITGEFRKHLNSENILLLLRTRKEISEFIIPVRKIICRCSYQKTVHILMLRMLDMAYLTGKRI